LTLKRVGEVTVGLSVVPFFRAGLLVVWAEVFPRKPKAKTINVNPKAMNVILLICPPKRTCGVHY
jgi:hypothetical protein